MLTEPKSPPSKIPRFSESGRGGSEVEIELGLGLGLGTSFDAEMRRYKENIVVDDRRKKVMEVSMGFTFMQRMEFQQQACIFKYIQSGLQVPYPLLYPLWKSVERSIDCAQFSLFPNLFGGSVARNWMGRTDLEPGRCKRTDGKKWRCAKEALPDSKYCEKHLHRGRQRSRKLVESSPTASSALHQNTYFPVPEKISLSVAQPGDN